MARWERCTPRTRRSCCRATWRTSGASTTGTSRRCSAFFQRRVRDPEVAADLTAETFAAAMVSRGRYQARTATAAAWLFAIAHHKLADHRRRGAAEHRMRARLGMEAVPVSAEDAEMIRWLGDEVATQMVEDLPAEQRDAIRAHVLDDRARRADRAEPGAAGAAGIEAARVTAASRRKPEEQRPGPARADVTARRPRAGWRSTLGARRARPWDAAGRRRARAAGRPGGRVIRVLTGQPDRGSRSRTIPR